MLRLRTILIVSLALLLVQSPTVGQPTDTTNQELTAATWEPASGVPEQGPIDVLAIALDFSESVQNDSLGARSHTAVRAELHGVEDSTYVIAIAFGTYSRIVADRVISSKSDQQSLARAIAQLDTGDFKGIEEKTDVAALERSLKNIRASLVSRYPHRQIDIRVTAITDGNPDPVDPESTQTFDRLLGEATTKTALGKGLFAYSTTLRIEGGNEPENEVRVGAQVREAIASTAERATSLPGWYYWALGALILVLLTGGLLWFLGPSFENPLDEFEETGSLEEPRFLTLEERVAPEEGNLRHVQGPRTIEYRPGIPVRIGSRGESTVVLQAPDAPSRLCELQLQNGQVRVIPRAKPLRLDGTEIDEPVDVNAADRHTIKHQRHEVQVSPRTSGRAEDYFSN